MKTNNVHTGISDWDDPSPQLRTRIGPDTRDQRLYLATGITASVIAGLFALWVSLTVQGVSRLTEIDSRLRFKGRDQTVVGQKFDRAQV